MRNEGVIGCLQNPAHKELHVPSANVVRCKECKREFGQEEGTFEADPKKGESWFKVTHTKCGKTFSVHHSAFYRRGGNPPQPRNPFIPVKISVPDW